METTNIKKLSKKDVVLSWWKWLNFCHSCYNYEVYQGIGFAHAMSYSLKKLYPNPEDLGRELEKHTMFFNSATHVGGLAHGATLALEEKRANDPDAVPVDLITSLKTGLMGPLAGIGDSVVQGIITPVYIAIGMSLTESLGIAGPIIYTVAIVATVLAVAYASWMGGYRLGTEAVNRLIHGGTVQKLLYAAGILGCTVLGALVSNYVKITTSVMFKFSNSSFILQTGFFDKLMPNFLSLATTLVVYWLIRKRVRGDHLIFILFVVGIILSLLGILGPVPVVQ